MAILSGRTETGKKTTTGYCFFLSNINVNKPCSAASWPLAFSHQCSWTHSAPCYTGRGSTDRRRPLPQRWRSSATKVKKKKALKFSSVSPSEGYGQHRPELWAPDAVERVGQMSPPLRETKNIHIERGRQITTDLSGCVITFRSGRTRAEHRSRTPPARPATSTPSADSSGCSPKQFWGGFFWSREKTNVSPGSVAESTGKERELTMRCSPQKMIQKQKSAA